jgi:hypothetical protein
MGITLRHFDFDRLRRLLLGHRREKEESADDNEEDDDQDGNSGHGSRLQEECREGLLATFKAAV